MAVPFGFSAGDIAMALKFTAKVVSALKETGGAASDYREVLQYLEGLLLTLQHLQRLDTPCADPSLVNAVRVLTTTAEQPVKDFVNEMSKYNSAMESSGSLSSSARKAEWAVIAAKKADKLRLKIAAQMEPIHLLLESQTLQCFDHTVEQNKNIRQSVDDHAARQALFNHTLLETLETLRKTVEKTSTAHNYSRNQTPKPHEIVSIAVPAQVLCHPSSSVAEMKRLGEQLCIVILHVLRDIQHLVTLLMLVSPQLLLPIRMLYQTLTRAPGWLSDDNIHFENALGEMRSLPFAYFRHLRVFEAFLEADFRSKPGEFQVALHHYQILTPGGVRLNGLSWTENVRPGVHIHMSINIPRNVDEILLGSTSFQRNRTVAKRQRPSWTSYGAVWEYKTCPDCGLQFFAMHKLRTSALSFKPTFLKDSDLVAECISPSQAHLLSPPRSLGPARDKTRRLLSFDSGNALPFKRMHIFGRAGHKSPHEDTISMQPPVSLLDTRATNDLDNDLLKPGDAGGGMVDMSSYRVHDVSNVSDATTVLERCDTTYEPGSRYPPENAAVRCDDASYHIRPIISMVTISERVKPWLSKSTKAPKAPRLQTLTCQFVHCARKFDEWKELDEHLRDDHQLDDLTPIVLANRSAGSEKILSEVPRTTRRDDISPLLTDGEDSPQLHTQTTNSATNTTHGQDVGIPDLTETPTDPSLSRGRESLSNSESPGSGYVVADVPASSFNSFRRRRR